MGGSPCAVSALDSGAASTISNPVKVGFGAATRCVDQVRSSPNAAAGPGRSAMRRARSVMIAATRLPYTSATPVPGGACTANTPPSGCATASLTTNCSLRTSAPSDGHGWPGYGRAGIVPHHQRLPPHVHAGDPGSVTVHAGRTSHRRILGVEDDLKWFGAA